MNTTFTQTFYRIQPPLNKHAVPLGLAYEIRKVLEQDDYLHILKTWDGAGDFGHHTTTETYLFYQRDDAFGVMQSVMRNLGLIEDGWDENEVITLDGADALEVDDVPEEDGWKIVPENLVLNAQEA